MNYLIWYLSGFGMLIFGIIGSVTFMKIEEKMVGNYKTTIGNIVGNIITLSGLEISKFLTRYGLPVIIFTVLMYILDKSNKSITTVEQIQTFLLIAILSTAVTLLTNQVNDLQDKKNKDWRNKV